MKKYTNWKDIAPHSLQLLVAIKAGKRLTARDGWWYLEGGVVEGHIPPRMDVDVLVDNGLIDLSTDPATLTLKGRQWANKWLEARIGTKNVRLRIDGEKHGSGISRRTRGQGDTLPPADPEVPLGDPPPPALQDQRPRSARGSAWGPGRNLRLRP